MKSSNIKISVGIPAHNEEENIAPLIEALKTQIITRGQITQIILIFHIMVLSSHPYPKSVSY